MSIASGLRVLLILLLAGPAFGQGIVVKGGATSNLATVDANGALSVTQGKSTRPTYTATVAGGVTTAAYNLQVESAASVGFRVQRVCVTYSLGATAAGTVITTTISRRNTVASSGGTALTNEGTGTTSISKHDWNAANYTGLARGLAATLGTAGATLDQWQFAQTVVAGTTGITPISMECRDYGGQGSQLLIAQAGVTNGIAVNVSAGGAGSLAVGSIAMTFTQE